MQAVPVPPVAPMTRTEGEVDISFLFCCQGNTSNKNLFRFDFVRKMVRSRAWYLCSGRGVHRCSSGSGNGEF